MADCIFCKIVSGEIPSSKIYEDDQVLSFLDINPINPGHALVIPRKHYANLLEIDAADLQACILACQKVARAVYQGVDAGGFNVFQNNFRLAGQLIDHIHFHIVPRFKRDGFLTSWPSTPYPPGEVQKIQEKLKSYL